MRWAAGQLFTLELAKARGPVFNCTQSRRLRMVAVLLSCRGTRSANSTLCALNTCLHRSVVSSTAGKAQRLQAQPRPAPGPSREPWGGRLPCGNDEGQPLAPWRLVSRWPKGLPCSPHPRSSSQVRLCPGGGPSPTSPEQGGHLWTVVGPAGPECEQPTRGLPAWRRLAEVTSWCWASVALSRLWPVPGLEGLTMPVGLGLCALSYKCSPSY